ncbi:hypothetical protein HK097_009302 [Rhizophlyctis rosea]|uniref:t-SNARE coiled-coil homology domain-containing protein n=1 Tax=Rhizophlyctis rosea TaxID=64517 RepID=A0AAD5X0J8_9FUNG|nr:hypothetical protein HK097_009302 [Rhizophlyctis rosea]
MSEIEDYDEQMTEILEQISGVLEKELPKLRGQERVEKCSYLKNRLTRATVILKSLRRELEDLSPDEVPKWSLKAGEYEKQIAKLNQDVNWAETSAERDDIKRKVVDDMSAKEMTTAAIQIQEQTQQSAFRARQLVEETIEMGMAVNQELKKQGEQITSIGENVETIESNLKRADKQMRVIMRRLATDKIFIFFIFLIVLLIIAAIVLVALRQKCIIHIGSELPKCAATGAGTAGPTVAEGAPVGA